MPIFKKKGWWYAKIDKGGEKWTPNKAGMDHTRWKTRRDAKLGGSRIKAANRKIKNHTNEFGLADAVQRIS